MNIFEYLLKINTLEKQFQKDKQDLCLSYVQENAKFKIGEFIQNVTGIIQIESISFVLVSGEPKIKYIGKRFWNNKGVLIPTKTKQKGELWEDVSHKYTLKK